MNNIYILNSSSLILTLKVQTTQYIYMYICFIYIIYYIYYIIYNI